MPDAADALFWPLKSKDGGTVSVLMASTVQTKTSFVDNTQSNQIFNKYVRLPDQKVLNCTNFL